VARHVDLAEVLLVEHADECTLRVVHPRVVGAREASRGAGAALDELGPAVAAHVDERAQHAVAVAHQQHGCAHHLERLVRVGFTQLGAEAEHQRQAPEDAVHLELPARGVVVVARRHTHDVVLERHRPVDAVGDVASRQGDELFTTHD
jgi:hypothetical protein